MAVDKTESIRLCTKKCRLYLELEAGRRIAVLEKKEKELEGITKGNPEMYFLKENLQICTANYHRILAIKKVISMVKYLETNSIYISQLLDNPQPVPPNNEMVCIIRSVAWSLYKINLDQAPEFAEHFKSLIGRPRDFHDYQIDREVTFISSSFIFISEC